MASEIYQLLERVQSSDASIRNEAEQLLKRMEAENFSLFLISLCAVFATGNKELHLQRLAVIILKNALDSKEHRTREAQARRWLELDGDIKKRIRNEVLRALHHPAVDLARTVSMLIAKIAAVDISRSEWPELIPALLGNMTSESPTSALRQATLETLGYVCEELASDPGFRIQQEVVNSILTAVVGGMVKDEKDDAVRLAATRALINALEFADTNFANEHERNYIMQVVCEGAICPTSEDIRVSSYECLIRICTTYYEHLPPYMNEIFKLTLHSIQSDEEPVAKQAIELWCTLCDEELDLQVDMEQAILEEDFLLHNIVKHCFSTLVPMLLAELLKQEEDQELDETSWTVSMAAGACLDLVSLTVGNDVAPIVLEFVTRHIHNVDEAESWRHREAAIFALGSIMEGTKSLQLLHYMNDNLHILITSLKDSDVSVRNTTAWTLGRAFEFLAFQNVTIPIITSQNLETTIHSMIQALNDEAHVANRVCFALSQLADAIQQSEALSLAPYLQKIIQSLVEVAFKPVADRGMQISLQLSAFEAINGMIRGAPDDCIELVLQMIPLLVEKLRHSLQPNPEEAERIPDMQGMICGCLGVVLRRLDSAKEYYKAIDVHVADGAMEILLGLFQSKHAAVHEESMLAIGSLTLALKDQFNRYMARVMPYLEVGLRNHQEIQVCISTIGTLSNICQAVSESIGPYCDAIMEVLIGTLQNTEVSRDIKPHILSTFADIALATGATFGKYLNVVTTILKSAIELSSAEGGAIDEAFSDYNVELRKGILEAYSGILQGIGRVEAEKCLHHESQYMINFLERVVEEAPRDELIMTVAVGLLGDIAHALPSLNPMMKQKKWIDVFVRDCMRSPIPSVKAAGRWAAAAIANAAQTTATSA